MQNVQEMVDSMQPGELVVFPRLLLATIALLPLSYVHLFLLALFLLSKVGALFFCGNQ